MKGCSTYLDLDSTRQLNNKYSFVVVVSGCSLVLNIVKHLSSSFFSGKISFTHFVLEFFRMILAPDELHKMQQACWTEWKRRSSCSVCDVLAMQDVAKIRNEG